MKIQHTQGQPSQMECAYSSRNGTETVIVKQNLLLEKQVYNLHKQKNAEEDYRIWNF